MVEKKEVALSLKIPANDIYLENALMSLDGICEHCSIKSEISDKIKTVLKDTLNDSIQILTNEKKNFFKIDFNFEHETIKIYIENIFNEELRNQKEKLANIKRKLENIALKHEYNIQLVKDLEECVVYLIQFNI